MKELLNSGTLGDKKCYMARRADKKCNATRRFHEKNFFSFFS